VDVQNLAGRLCPEFGTPNS